MCRWSLIALAVLLASPGPALAEDPSMQLTLSISNTLELFATLQNRSDAELAVLNAPELQPVVLVLVDASGKRHEPFDERTRRKLDRSVSAAMFAHLRARVGQAELEHAQFTNQPDGAYALQWGPFAFSDLPPGKWIVHAELASRIDETTGAGSHKVPGVWTGVARSAELAIVLPDAKQQAAAAAHASAVARAQDRARRFLEAHKLSAEVWHTDDTWFVASGIEHRTIASDPAAPPEHRHELREQLVGPRGVRLALSVTASATAHASDRVTRISGALVYRTEVGSVPLAGGGYLTYSLDAGAELDDRFVAALVATLRP